MSRELIGNMLENCNETTAIAFTDGSCLGNPGQCGAGACIFPPGHTEPILLKHRSVYNYVFCVVSTFLGFKIRSTDR